MVAVLQSGEARTASQCNQTRERKERCQRRDGGGKILIIWVRIFLTPELSVLKLLNNNIQILYFQRCTDENAIKQPTYLSPFSSGLIPTRDSPGGRRGQETLVSRASDASRSKEEKTIIGKL